MFVESIRLGWPCSIDILPVVMEHYWVNSDEACGAGDSCQIIQLRKVEDMRFRRYQHQFIWAVITFMIGWWCISGSYSGVRESGRICWALCCSPNSQEGLGRAGEGGSVSSLRGSGKNWSEQTGDCSCCLIRTDVTQHNPPQQSVLRLEWVILERKVQGAWKAAALYRLTAHDRECVLLSYTTHALSHTHAHMHTHSVNTNVAKSRNLQGVLTHITET